MGSPLDLYGVYVPLITPFSEDGRPALEEIERLANKSIDEGAAGIVALGTTGEPATLQTHERAEIIEIIASVCRQRSAQLIIGAGTNSTEASIEAVKKANKVSGVCALLSVVPYYTRPSELGVVSHFKSLAKISSTPIVVYNIPYRTGRGLGSESLLELARTDNIGGVKQAVGGIDIDTLRLMANKPADFHVLCGDDAYVYSLMCLGASGAIAASAHVRTSEFVALVDFALKKDFAQANEISNRLLPLCERLFAEPNPSVIKGVLAAKKLISTPQLRMPMMKATESAVTQALEVC